MAQIRADRHAERNQMIFLIVVTVLALVLVAYDARAVRQRLGARAWSNQNQSG